MNATTLQQNAANEVLADLMSAEHERLSEKVGHRNWTLGIHTSTPPTVTYWIASFLPGIRAHVGLTPDEAVAKMLSDVIA